MPHKSGLDIIKDVYYICPEIKIIIISMHRAHIYIEKALELGVKAYLHKENVAEELLPALISIIYRNKVYVSTKLSEYFIERMVASPNKQKETLTLTTRENDILRLVVEGKTAKEIAKNLFISVRTVENHKNSLLKKLDLRKTSDLIKYALEYNIVD